MKKIKAAALIMILGLSALVFSFSAFLSTVPSRATLHAGTATDAAFEKRFEYIEPTGTWGTGGKGSLDLSKTLPQQFNLQSRFFNGKAAAGGSFGEEISSSTLPVFSSTDMTAIVNGTKKIYESAAVDNAAIIMLDNDDLNYDNKVVLELTNLSTITNYSATFNGTPISFVNMQTNSVMAESNKRDNVGKIYWNNDYTFRGMFQQEGYYQFKFSFTVWGLTADRPMTLEFGFYIINASEYKDMPVFDLDAAGQPLLPGLMRPSAANITTPINNDQFYYNYQDSFPYIDYQKNRFDVNLQMTDYNQVSQEVDFKDNNNKRTFTFNKIGAYQIEAKMIFYPYWDGINNPGRKVEVSIYTVHNYYLTIYGFQAYYQDYTTVEGPQKWLGGVNDTNSDISNKKGFATASQLKIDTTSAASMTGSANSAIDYLTNNLDGITPVVTNMPPVNLRYNVEHAFADSAKTQILSRVAYRKNSNAAWSYKSGDEYYKEYKIAQPYQEAGEYAVIVYYKYAAAENNVSKIYHQVFYFKIDDFCADVRLATYASVDSSGNPVGSPLQIMTFAEFMNKETYLTGAFYLYQSNTNSVGAYEAAPKFELNFKSFDGLTVKQISDYNPRNPSAMYGDGIYTFRIYFGNNQSITHMPYMDFVVVLDNTLINSFNCVSTSDSSMTIKDTISGTPQIANISIFGGGDVTLSWNKKESGIDMKSATLDFYEFKSSSNPVIVTDVYSELLNSQYQIQSVHSRNLRIVSTDTGFKLADKLSATGLYVITIMDAAGNKSIYIIIIDATTATFAQNPEIDPAKINVKSNSDGVNVGFGKNKLVSTVSGGVLDSFYNELKNIKPYSTSQNTSLRTRSLYDMLIANGLFLNKTVDSQTVMGIAVPISNVDMSLDNVSYSTVYDKNKVITSTNNYYKTLNPSPSTQATYFFNLYDALGNVATHYVQVNFDETQGIVFEDSTTDIISNNSISATATIVQDKNISNRDYLTFSFLQTASESAAFHVNSIKVAYYEMTFQKTVRKLRTDSYGNPVYSNGALVYDEVDNTNYPFSETPEVYTVDMNNSSTIDGERLFININRQPKTKQGLYVISRICNNATSAQRIKNYIFIVDNNPIISGSNFESGINVVFGSGSDTSTAVWNDFQKENNSRMEPSRDRVLQSNNMATVNLPSAMPGKSSTGNTGTKYGNGTFKILTGDFETGSYATPVNMVFDSMKLTKTVERKATDSDVFEDWGTKALNQNGMYRVAFTDGSGGYSWILGNNSNTYEGNRSEILIELFMRGPQGAFYLNGGQVSQSGWQPSGADGNVMHSVNVNYNSSSQTSDVLTFVFSNDTANFMQPIGQAPEIKKYNGTSDTKGINLTIIDRNTNISNQKPGATQALRSISTVGTITSYEYTLPIDNASSGDTFTIKLTTSTTPIRTLTYEILIDNTPPKSNLNRIMTTTEGDKWFYDGQYSTQKNQVLNKAGGYLPGDSLYTSDNPLKYPFRISNDFVFRQSTGNPNFDTYTISYFEVDSSFANISGEKVVGYAPASYTAGNKNEKTFYEWVGMTAYQNRYFRIIEQDEAGNRSEYFVQLRGANYKDSIDASGVVEYALDSQNKSIPTGNLISGNIIGTSGQVVRGSSLNIESVQTFFNSNLYFELSGGGITIRRLGLEDGTKKMLVNTTWMEATTEQFTKQLQNILNSGLEITLTFTLNNRFETVFQYGIMQIKSSTATVDVVGNDYYGNVSTTIRIDSTSEFLQIFRNSNFIFDVYDLNNLKNGALYTYYNVREITLPDAINEYLVIVTDEFGRQVKYAYNGLYGSYIYFSSSDNAKYLGSELYIGDKDGVYVTYSTNAYDFYIYRNDVLVYENGLLKYNELADYVKITGNVMFTDITILPEENKQSSWRLMAIRRGTGDLWLREFNLYAVLPVLSFANPSGENLTAKLTSENMSERETSGIVTVSYSSEGLLFGASVSYTRTYENPKVPGEYLVDYVPIGQYTTKFNLTYAGVYVFEVTNEIGAKNDSSRYVFEILDVTNKSYKISFLDSEIGEYQELKASPTAYYYNAKNIAIPNFFVKGDISDINVPYNKDNNPNGKLKIEPTSNSLREIIGREENTSIDKYGVPYEIISNANTVIYRLVSPVTQTELYFAISYVPSYTGVLNNVMLNVTDNSVWDTLPAVSDDRYKVYYQNFGANRNLAEGIITVRLNKDFYDFVNGNTGDILYVDYYRNGDKSTGEYCGTLIGTQELKIRASDYGTYTFYVYDQAGNKRMFGSGLNAVSYYTIVNLARGPLLITDGSASSESIINGMVYNDGVSLSIMDIPYDSTINGINYSFAKRLTVYKNNELREDLSYEAATKAQERKSFAISEPGNYTIYLEYQLTASIAIGNVLNPLTGSLSSQYSFTLASSTQSQQSFSFNAASNMEIIGIKFNGTDIRKNFTDKILKNLSLNSSTGNGTYIITVLFSTNNIYAQTRVKTFVVVIKTVPRIDITCNISYGTSTTSKVNLSFNPRLLYSIYDECKIIVMRGNNVITSVNVGLYGTVDLVNAEYSLISLSDKGKYKIYITNAGSEVVDGKVYGDVYYAEGFEITAGINALGIIVILLIIAAVVIGIFIFIRLRTNMRVR